MNDQKHIDLPAIIAGFYPRVSKANGRDAEELERHTISEQREYALGHLPRRAEMLEREEWKDVNVSGKNFDRPGLSRIFDAIEAGEINAVAVGYLSRFGRNARELLENVQKLRELGATLFIGKERLTILPDEDDPYTNLIVTILAAVAELERARLSEQLGRANRTAINNGVSIQIPYGYRRSNGAGSPLEIDDSTEAMPDGWTPAAVVRVIFTMRANGAGDSAIANHLNGLGILTPTALEYARGARRKPGAKVWRHNAVANVAECHTYRGVIPRGVEFRGQGRRRRAISWEFLPGEHPPLIDPDLWEQAQQRRTPKRPDHIGGSVLTGLVRCGNCSQRMRPNKNGQGYLTYACRGRKSGCSEPTSVTRAGVDAYVVERLLEGQTDAIIRERQNRAELEAAELAEREAERELADFDKYAKASEYGEGFMDARRRRLVARDRAAERAAKLRAKLSAAGTRKLSSFDELPLDERQAALGELLDAVVIFRTAPGGSARDYDARVELCPAGAAPFELSASGRIVGPRPWPRH